MKPYYQDDAVTIYHGDCRDVLPSLEPVHMALTSPPYGDIRDYGGQDAIDPRDALTLLAACIMPGGVIVWNTADQTVNGSESGESFRQALHGFDVGLRLHDTMIYCREGVTFPDSNRYLPAFEYMFVFSKGSPRCFNGIQDRRNKWGGTPIHGTTREADGSLRPPSRKGQLSPDFGLRWNWWVMKTAANEDPGPAPHPARMPYAMASGHIRTWSNARELVLDPLHGQRDDVAGGKGSRSPRDRD